MKNPPTLADAVMGEWSHPGYRRIGRPQVLTNLVAKARKFVLDESMSAYMADLAHASLLTTNDAYKSQLLLEALRQSARLPHEIVWIEHDKIATMQRSASEYGMSPPPGADAPLRHGWLCWQHRQLDTAFAALSVSSHSIKGGKSVPKPASSPFCYAWRSDDGPPPWPHIPGVEVAAKTETGTEEFALPVEAVLTGRINYRNDNVRIIPPPHLSIEFVRQYFRTTQFNPFGECTSDLRYLWAFLATINDVPVTTTFVKQDRGYVSRGRYRKFCDHTVIRLTVPAARWRRLAAQTIAIARRRAHQVRGFWRKDWRRPLSPLCEHQFDADGMTCTACQGHRIWVHEHQRGDASLGFVTHDYVVEHGQEAGEASS
jgi:hypothetical protein